MCEVNNIGLIDTFTSIQIDKQSLNTLNTNVVYPTKLMHYGAPLLPYTRANSAFIVYWIAGAYEWARTPQSSPRETASLAPGSAFLSIVSVTMR
jgi:hypothetical protein